MSCLGNLLWWVGLGQLPDPQPAPPSLLLLQRTGVKNEMAKLEGSDKDREITHHDSVTGKRGSTWRKSNELIVG